MKQNFLNCNLSLNNPNFLKSLNTKEGYYLLRVEKDEVIAGEQEHETFYVLMEVSPKNSPLGSLTTFNGEPWEWVTWKDKGMVTGFLELGLEHKIIKKQ